MNLVIDDAVEVRLATKNEEEQRRPLGMYIDLPCSTDADINYLLQARYSSRATTSPSFRSSRPLNSPPLQISSITHHDCIDQPVMLDDGDVLGEQLLLERQGN